MDDDDPEKRIAELESRLAEPPGPAVPGPPRYRDAREQPAPIPGPVPGHGEPIAPRVYVATVLDMKWGYPKVIGLIAALVGGPFVLPALLHTTSGEVALWMHDVLLFAVIPLLLLAVYVTRSRRLKSFVSGRWPEVTIRVTPDTRGHYRQREPCGLPGGHCGSGPLDGGRRTGVRSATPAKRPAPVRHRRAESSRSAKSAAHRGPRMDRERVAARRRIR
ncbi:MAG: hypothetical protein QOD10_296 [Mycobacterium sp.]|jgi:hypothetical protein|nr:hypothetical protein [Mycobacterium sp.]